MISTPILETRSLTIGFRVKNKTKTVFKNININIKQGQLISIIGANGIGKSTLLRTLTGAQKPLSGDVMLCNSNLQQMSKIAIAKKLSVVYTDRLPPSNLSVFELVALGRQPYTNWLGKLSATDLEKIHWAIKLTEIEHLQNQKHYELSDGQLQKVLVARALAQDSPLIILDEPTTHLDLVNKVLLFKLLKKLTIETNKCILLSTHDLDLAIQISDEVVVMIPEKLVQDTPKNLIENNILNTIFNDEHILFDAITKNFQIQ